MSIVPTLTGFFLLTVPFPPSNLSVTQNGRDTVLVSWSPSDGVDGYIVYYQEEGSRRYSRQAGADDTSFTLTRLNAGKTYSISMVAYTGFYSTEAGPVNITIGRYYNDI